MIEPRLPREFAQQRYTLLKQLIPAPDCSALCMHVLALARAEMLAAGDTMLAETPCFYGLSCMEQLLVDLLPTIERVSDLHLYPTYSYLRLYQRGDTLFRHTDRPACELSLSLSLGYDAAEPWGLWVEGPQGDFCARLEPGDVLLYRGIECPHWREPFQGEYAVQVFLHYVDQHGPYAEWKFDRRAGLNLSTGAAPRGCSGAAANGTVEKPLRLSSMLKRMKYHAALASLQRAAPAPADAAPRPNKQKPGCESH